MARRSILSAAREERPAVSIVPAPTQETQTAPPATKGGRSDKLHVGGYFDPTDPIIIAFQKLKVDLRRSQQDMLLDALRDFVAKQEAASAFR
jgi:hypothetical protein